MCYSAEKMFHTETFPCVFVLFHASNELVVLDSLENYSKQYKNAGKRFRVYGAIVQENESNCIVIFVTFVIETFCKTLNTLF